MTDPIQGHRPARGRLAIPYLTPSGPVGITFRCIEDHRCRDIEKHSKYWKPSGSEPEPYGVMDIFKDSLDIHATEGELDAIILSELCGMPSMGIPGAQYWKPWWKLILSDFQRVFIWGDGDQAGQQFIQKLQKEMGRAAIAIHVPDGEDVNSLYLKYGAEKIKEMAK